MRRAVPCAAQSYGHKGFDLAALTSAWRDAGLLITRAKVRPCLPPALGSPPAPAASFSSPASAAGAAPPWARPPPPGAGRAGGNGGGGGNAAHAPPPCPGVANTFYLVNEDGTLPDPARIAKVRPAFSTRSCWVAASSCFPPEPPSPAPGPAAAAVSKSPQSAACADASRAELAQQT